MTPPAHCERCGGSGRWQLPRVHAKTLEIIRAAKSPVGRAELEDGGIPSTQVQEHLVFLEQHGLIIRTARRRQAILWTAVDSAGSREFNLHNNTE